MTNFESSTSLTNPFSLTDARSGMLASISLPMKEQGAEILAGRARSTSARHYLLNMIDEMVDHYRQGWLTYGVDFKLV
jgi:hypothetical protein